MLEVNCHGSAKKLDLTTFTGILGRVDLADTTRKLLWMRAPCGIDKGLHHADDNENGIILLLVGHSFNIGDKRTILIKFSRRNSNNLIHHNHHHDCAWNTPSSVKVILVYDRNQRGGNWNVIISLRHIIL